MTQDDPLLRERWPPVYDADQLARDISQLVKRGLTTAQFYTLRSLAEPRVCQGDVFLLEAGVPVIDEDGEAVALGDQSYWLVIGNTCDFARTIGEVPWTQAVPIDDLGQDVSATELSKLQGYQASRVFYLPAWSGSVGHCVADLLRPVAVHKQCFVDEKAKVVARLDRPAWVLLHSCLIRFLARDDGRFD